jgi:hypothetical protein
MHCGIPPGRSGRFRRGVGIRSESTFRAGKILI